MKQKLPLVADFVYCRLILYKAVIDVVTGWKRILIFYMREQSENFFIIFICFQFIIRIWGRMGWTTVTLNKQKTD